MILLIYLLKNHYKELSATWKLSFSWRASICLLNDMHFYVLNKLNTYIDKEIYSPIHILKKKN